MVKKKPAIAGDDGDSLPMIERLRGCTKKIQKPNSDDGDRRSKRIQMPNSTAYKSSQTGHGMDKTSSEIADGGESSSTIDLLRRRSKRLQMPNSAVLKFMLIVPDDLLLEIFLRLPNGRSVVQCATVCKRWCSLIVNPGTGNSFIEYHRRKQSLDPSYFPAYTSAFLFNYTKLTDTPSYQISAESRPFRLKVFPHDCAVRASCGDLLLLSRGLKKYYIYNPHTGQQIAVPEAPPFPEFEFPYTDEIFKGFIGYGLVVRDPKEKLTRYRVVIIDKSSFLCNNYQFRYLMFNSETGLWTRRQLRVPYRMPYNGKRGSTCHVVTLEVALTKDGLLHWLVCKPHLEGYVPDEFAGVLAFDPFSFEYGLVPLPDGQFRGIPTTFVKHKVRLGVVRGRLWLSRMVEIEEAAGFGLKVWELDSAVDSWRLVHDVVLRKCGDCSVLCMLAFDPSNGSVVYLVRDREVYRYEIGLDKYEKVCEFPYNSNESIDMMKQRIAFSLKVVTILHSLWPMRLQI